ncbi:putative magnesium and cobalt transport protein [Rhypophila decipiens]
MAEARMEEWWTSAGGFNEELEGEFRDCFREKMERPLEEEVGRREYQGRAAIFGNDVGNGLRQFGPGPENITEFASALEDLANKANSTDSSLKSSNTLIILEDLGKDWVEILGPVLKIPVYFFALHWAMPLKHLNGDIRLPVGQSPERHFILPYQQELPFRITASDIQESKVFCRCIANRDVARGKRDTCVQLASYWGIKTKSGGWIAVLLLDPCFDNPEGFFTVDSRRLIDPRTLEFWKRRPHADRWARRKVTAGDYMVDEPPRPGEEASRVLSSKTGGANTVVVEHRSMLQQLVDFYPFENDVLEGSTPLSATWYIRRLVLAQATFLVRRSLFAVTKLTLEAAADTKRIGEFNMQDIRESGWSGEWKGKFYTQIWELRENLQRTSHMLQQTHTTFQRISRIESLRNQTNPDLVEYGVEKNACDEWEWEDVQHSLDFGLQMLDRTRDTYVEAVGATAAKLANDQAISSRQISGYAAIFVPASLTAAVLAIPAFAGDDNSKFWIFWAVSAPLAVFVWVWYMTGLQGWLKQTHKDMNELKKDAKAGNYGSLKPRLFYLWELAHVSVGRETSSMGGPAQLARMRKRSTRDVTV